MKEDFVDAVDVVDGNLQEKTPRAFPTSALPRSAERIVKEASDAIGCPPELVALPVLVTLSSAIGNSRVLKLKNGWEQGERYGWLVLHHRELKNLPRNRKPCALLPSTRIS